ncbi:MAG: DUF4982 domain-containing protein [Clostridia bacterium]|nr:DUF4982 domain-containing protein [Clostridia bacterium]
MIKQSFNKGWEFTLENNLDHYNNFGFEKYLDASGAAAHVLKNSNWDKIDLPHDWALALPKEMRANAFAGGRANSPFNRGKTEQHSDIEEIYNVGWYRKQFSYDGAWKDKRVFIEFEGIFRDATVWVNGVYMTRHTSGYTSFVLDITDHLREGMVNSVAVRADSTHPEGWWYEGAGIYRNVNLYIAEPVYLKMNKTFIRSDVSGKISVSALLVNDTPDVFSKKISWTVMDACQNAVASIITEANVSPYGESEISAELFVNDPTLWDLDNPYLYTLEITLGDTPEKEITAFGIRSAIFDPDKGFLLNGRQVKIHGACVHQDFGGVGVALTDNLQYYKIKRLKEMGANAYRSSHHAPSPVILRACDELGMLVMDETRMFGTSPEAIEQLTSLVERDRNHPSVIIWTIGNEEFSIQNEAFSRPIAEKVSRILKTLDDTRAITYGGNNGGNDIGANVGVEVRGINYVRNGNGDWVAEYHRKHPEQPIIGTEESSYVLSRGGHINDLTRGLLDCTGNVTMMWGTTPRGWVQFVEEHDYFSGSFMWTGFDYRGEGNPFVYSNPCSSFGTIDLCGMEKPPFYYYRSWWTDEPTVYALPHWNFAEGEIAKISVFTNCEKVSLFVNGRCVGEKTPEKFETPVWEIPFEAGVLRAVGIKNGKEYIHELVSAGKVSEIRASDVIISENDKDVGIIELAAYDEKGVFCPLDDTQVTFDLSGDGEIVGVGNGDSASFDYEKKPAREDVLNIRYFTDDIGMFCIPQKRENTDIRRYDMLYESDILPWLPEGERTVAGYMLSKKETTVRVLKTNIDNANGFKYIEFERLGGATEIFVNNEKIGDNFSTGRADRTNTRPYRFYYDFGEGVYELKLVCSIKTASTAENDPVSGYVKLGRTVDEPWKVRLHYGKARIFVKNASAKEIVLK